MMNERIKKLAKEAGIYNLNLVETEYWILEKFAELVVKECVAQIEIERGNPYRNMGDENRYGIGACVESIRRIKEHFGVTE